MGKTHNIGCRDHYQTSSFHTGIFQKKNSRQVTCRFIWMSTAKYKSSTSLFFSFLNENRLICRSPLNPIKVIRKLCFPEIIKRIYLFGFPHGHEALRCKITDNTRETKEQKRSQPGSLKSGFHKNTSLDHQNPQNKRYNDKSSSYLFPEILLLENTPYNKSENKEDDPSVDQSHDHLQDLLIWKNGSNVVGSQDNGNTPGCCNNTRYHAVFKYFKVILLTHHLGGKYPCKGSRRHKITKPGDKAECRSHHDLVPAKQSEKKGNSKYRCRSKSRDCTEERHRCGNTQIKQPCGKGKC